MQLFRKKVFRFAAGANAATLPDCLSAPIASTPQCLFISTDDTSAARAITSIRPLVVQVAYQYPEAPSPNNSPEDGGRGLEMG